VVAEAVSVGLDQTAAMLGFFPRTITTRRASTRARISTACVVSAFWDGSPAVHRDIGVGLTMNSAFRIPNCSRLASPAGSQTTPAHRPRRESSQPKRCHPSGASSVEGPRRSDLRNCLRVALRTRRTRSIKSLTLAMVAILHRRVLISMMTSFELRESLVRVPMTLR
jgi:hypothetical protein